MNENSTPFLQCEILAAHAIDTVVNDFVLGLHCVGESAASIVHDLPMQRIAMPMLDDKSDLLYECWRTNESCYSGRFQNIVFRASDSVLFGVIEIDESSLDLSDGESALRIAAETAYREIFLLLRTKKFDHLWRTWNYLPNIHAQECELERYRQFNIGRHWAFIAADKSVENSPAASALGTKNGLFSVAFMAGRIEPTRIENPRQISAFTYPDQYGPRSPTFTRAMTVADDEYETLFISGTASIVGHETIHRGDVAAQTQETIANLTALLEQVNLNKHATPYALKNLMYRVYIRHANDYQKVREVLETSIDSKIRAVYVQADICRQDLLVEIEAFAIKQQR